MLRSVVTMDRPQRWDAPFDTEMSTAVAARLKRIPPFASMDPKAFPASLPLDGILLNDTRLRRYEPGDIIVREGDYGHSAMLILSGSVRVTLQRLPADWLGRPVPRRPSFFAMLRQWWLQPRYPEVRRLPRLSADAPLGQRSEVDGEHVFLQDVPGVLNRFHTLGLGPGEVFGELAALSRSPRTATVFAETRSLLLEIRWQGLRDLMRFDSALTDHIHRLYRRNSLEAHLRETPWLQSLPIDLLRTIADATQFESHGDIQWSLPGDDPATLPAADRVQHEPVIASEGAEPTHLILIRSGFARVSRRLGDGHRTLAYLGKGAVFGMPELVRGWSSGSPCPLQSSLRAMGHVDVLRIPAEVLLRDAIPRLASEGQLQPLLADARRLLVELPARSSSHLDIDPGLVEFLGEKHLINGARTMVIDLDRCTRCDDCLRACAATHGNNPRFVREGPRHDNLMFAHACMHCADPVCMIGCPTGAIARDETSGVVRINDATCIGCGTCARGCPYDNIQMVEIHDARGNRIVDARTHQPIQKATKCDLCADAWGGPACQRACPHDALVRIDTGDVAALARWIGKPPLHGSTLQVEQQHQRLSDSPELQSPESLELPSRVPSPEAGE